jgi:two-component system, NarL family, sensor histidine kinase YdfH
MQAPVQSATPGQSERNQQVTRPLCWFLLVWESLVYIWALSSVKLDPGEGLKQSQPVIAGASYSSPLMIVLFTMLMLAQATLLWIGLSGKLPRRLIWLYFCVQGLLVFASGWMMPQENVGLNLYLALILGAIALLRRARDVLIVVLGYAVLFLFGSQTWNSFFQVGWNVYLAKLGARTDYAALLLLVVGFLVLYMQQVRIHHQLARANEQLQASAQRIEELTLVTERQRLARDLHDTLAQGVAGLIMQLEAANAQLGQQHLHLVEDILHAAMTSARGTLAEARRAIDDLRIISSRADFVEAVDEEIQRFTVATGITCETELQALNQVPATLYEHAFLAVREGLNNIARHAQAHAAIVRIVPEGDTLVIEVQDDGIGFEPESAAKQPGHYGLVGLHERARLTGGVLDVHSARGAGTTLRLLLPRYAEGDALWMLPSAS